MPEPENEHADLLPPGRIRARGIYKRARADYAHTYGATARTVGNWIRHGGERGEFPPLDDPKSMVAWWGKFMEHRVPEKIYTAAAAAGTDPAVDAVVKKMETRKDELFSGSSSSGNDAEELSLGFLPSLLRTRTEEAKAHRRYQRAVEEDPPDEGKIRVLQKTWQDLADHLRALEKAAPEVLRKSGDMWLGVDIVRELADIHGAIGSGVRTLGRRWSVKVGIEWTVAYDRAFQEEVDRLFSRLHESKFVAHE